MENRLVVKNAPHAKTSLSVRAIMIHIIIALLPTAVVGIKFFGISALNVIIVCVCSSVVFEILFDTFSGKEKQIIDFSAIAKGFLLALVLPANTPIWLCMLASGVMIVLFKNCFGKLEYGNINAVAGTKLFVVLLFGGVVPVAKNVSIMSLAEFSFSGLLIGAKQGCIGEICSIALIAGIVYLIALKIIDWKIPVITVVLTFFLFLCFNQFVIKLALIQLLSGSVLFACTFLAFDFASSPQTTLGKVLYCIILSFLIVLFRMFASFNELSCLAIVLANLFVPFLEKFSLNAKYGHKNKGLKNNK